MPDRFLGQIRTLPQYEGGQDGRLIDHIPTCQESKRIRKFRVRKFLGSPQEFVKVPKWPDSWRLWVLVLGICIPVMRDSVAVRCPFGKAA